MATDEHFGPKNLLVGKDRMLLLDHEVIHLGDPAFDLGFAFAHFLSKAHHMPLRRELLLAGAEGFSRRYRDGAPEVTDAHTHALVCLGTGRSSVQALRRYGWLIHRANPGAHDQPPERRQARLPRMTGMDGESQLHTERNNVTRLIACSRDQLRLRR